MPGKTSRVEIVMNKHAEYPADDPTGKSLTDKFQVQAMNLEQEIEADKLPAKVRAWD
jgi:hypothetical protein